MPEVEEKPRKRMGRPPKAPEKGRRQNYTFRMSDQTRDSVIEAASKSGRSMSEELEWRIEESFREENRLALTTSLLNGSDNLRKLILRIASVVGYLENMKDREGSQKGSVDWPQHEPTRAGVRAAVIALVEDATAPVRDLNRKEINKQMSEILSQYNGNEKISDADHKALSRLHDELTVDDMVTYGRLMADVISGKIRIDVLRATLGPPN